MPNYCFVCAECRTHWEQYAPMCAAPDTSVCPKCGTNSGRDYGSEMIGNRRCDLWPMVSEAAAIDPDQIPDAREVDRRNGVPTEYTPTGEPIFRSRQHRRAYLKAHGLYDRDGGYGDS